MSMCRIVSCVVGRVYLLWPECSLGKTLLVFAMVASYFRYLLSSYFCIPVPCDEKDLFFVVLEGLVGLHRTIPLQLLQHWRLGHRVGLLWYWMVCLGNEQKSFCHFWDCTSYYISDYFVDYEGYSISSKGFLPTVVDIMSSELNSPIPVHFSSLIPKMLMFTLAISCLTTSNLP